MNRMQTDLGILINCLCVYGPGLPLVQRLVELHNGHNGQFQLESQIDIGTVATITFPSEQVLPRHELDLVEVRQA